MAKRKLPDELIFIENKKAIQNSTTASMAGKVCVVCGSTSGVGLEAVKRLARGGAHIVMICRNPDKAKAIRTEIVSQHNVGIDIITSDFSALDDVRKAADTLIKDYPQIDVLINSAGLYSTTRTTTQDGFETVFCVNHLAPFLLTYLLVDRLIQSAPARIIQVNSEGHRFGGLDLSDLNWETPPLHRTPWVWRFKGSAASHHLGIFRPPEGVWRHHQRHAPGRREDEYRQ